MKAILFDDYGPASVLRYDDAPDPAPGEGEALVRVAATSVNPVDVKIRSGAVRDRMPVDLPSIPGVDVAGEVLALGSGVTSLKVGDRVMGMASGTYAELCLVKADAVTLVPEGLDVEDAATLPLVTVTGYQLVRESAKAQAGQRILVTGALGAVGRSAVFAASGLGCHVIAGVRGRQSAEAAALPGVDEVIAIDDDAAIAALAPVDAVADAVGGEVATKTIRRVREGGVFGTAVRGPYEQAGVEVNALFAHADAATIRRYAEAVRDGVLTIPRGPSFLLRDAAVAQEAATAGGTGKVVLTV
ncbi:NADP-dependent oxidoreductase [Sphingomonas bacterium]|uniref:NADP-dependent oxidoreductase n=1 Tax=Sphingomonas bacterium TaxID=1895847 RepID=UPI0015760675|nr:NADP-dependent oxidoreductase [Sphingomonas bacterium]